MERCATCQKDVLMSHPLDRCVRCSEPTCPECVFAHVVICKTCAVRKTPIPRLPTAHEKRALIAFLRSHRYDTHTAKQLRLLEERAYIAVFDSSTVESPGSRRNLMLVLWDDTPFVYEFITAA